MSPEYLLEIAGGVCVEWIISPAVLWLVAKMLVRPHPSRRIVGYDVFDDIPALLGHLQD